MIQIVLENDREKQKNVQTLQSYTEVALADIATHFTSMQTYLQQVLWKVDLCQARVSPCFPMQRKLVK